MTTPIDAEVKGPSESPSSLDAVSFTTLVWRDPANPDNKGECVFEPIVRHPVSTKSMGPPIQFVRRVSGRAKKHATTTKGSDGILGSLSDDDVEEVHPDPLTLLAQAIPAHLALASAASLEIQPEAIPTEASLPLETSDVAAPSKAPLSPAGNGKRKCVTWADALVEDVDYRSKRFRSEPPLACAEREEGELTPV